MCSPKTGIYSCRGTPMAFVRDLLCPRCQQTFPLGRVMNLCPCGSPLLVRYDLERVQKEVSKSSLRDRPRSLWRYMEWLPLQAPGNITSLGEGSTPLIEAPRIAAELNLARVLVKDESRNPTGSFKDRGLSVAMSMAHEMGIRKVAIPSAGNAASSLAAYAARVGMEAHVFMPRDAPAANQIEVKRYGARLTLIDGLISDCGRMIAEGKAKAIELVNEAADKYFKGNAKELKMLEVTEGSLKANSKIVLTDKGISPTLLIGELPMGAGADKAAETAKRLAARQSG